MRKGGVGGIIAGIIVTVVVGYFLVSPLFISTEVNEPIPTGEMAAQEYQEFVSLPEDDMMHMATLMSEKEKEMVMIGASQVTRPVDENVAGMGEQEVSEATIQELRSGTFIGVGGHPAEGIAKIISVNGQEYLRFEEFMVINGPDLRVYLTSSGDIDNGEHLEKLRGSKGDQNYSLANIDTSKYDTVVIFCQPFRVVFAIATLG